MILNEEFVTSCEEDFMKRMGLFIIYDAEGIVDDYVYYLLDKLSEYIDTFHIIVNGKIKKEYKERLRNYTNKIIIRKNVGFDGGAYRDYFINHSSKEQLSEYDEIVIFNDTFFGPLYSLKSMFDEMGKRGDDFWGITRHPKYKGDGVPLIQEHLQSYFLVVKKKMFLTDTFFEYWRKMGTATNFDEAVRGFEVSFTQFFEKEGFKWSSYIDSSKYDNAVNYKTNYNQYHFEIFDMISEMKHPFIKKKDFALYSDGSPRRTNSLEYIDKKTEYPVELIWKTILRKHNICDLYFSLNLNAIVSEEKGGVARGSIEKNILIFASHIGSVDIVISKIHKLPNMNYKYCIFCKDKILADKYRNTVGSVLIDYCIEIMDNNDLANEQVQQQVTEVASKSQYVCFLHDIAIKEDLPGFVYRMSFDALWDSCVGTDDLCNNIVERFEDNKNLGVLSSPFLNHTVYIDSDRNTWRYKYSDIKKTLKSIDVSVNTAEDKYPQFNCSTFWCRSELLVAFIEKINVMSVPKFYNKRKVKGLEDAERIAIARNHMIEIIFPFFAQNEGYYCENLYSIRSAEVALASYERGKQTKSMKLVDARLSEVRDGYENQISILEKNLKECHDGYEKQISILENDLKECHDGYEKQIRNLENELANCRDGYENQIKILEGDLGKCRDGYEEYVASLEERIRQLTKE